MWPSYAINQWNLDFFNQPIAVVWRSRLSRRTEISCSSLIVLYETYRTRYLTEGWKAWRWIRRMNHRLVICLFVRVTLLRAKGNEERVARGRSGETNRGIRAFAKISSSTRSFTTTEFLWSRGYIWWHETKEWNDGTNARGSFTGSPWFAVF